MKRKRTDTSSSRTTRDSFMKKLRERAHHDPNPQRRYGAELLLAAISLQSGRKHDGNGALLIDGTRVPVAGRIDEETGKLRVLQVGDAEVDPWPAVAAAILRRKREREDGS